MFVTAKSQVLNHRTLIRVDTKKKVTRISRTIQLNSKADTHLAQIAIPYSSYQKFNFIEASIRNEDRHILRKIKKKDVTVRSDLSYDSFYTDGLIAEFTMHWDTYPYLITYTYEIIERDFLSIAHWYPILYSNYDTLSGDLEVQFPSDYPVHISYSNVLSLKDTIRENTRFLTCSTQEYPAVSDEVLAVPLAESLPHIDIVPQHFRYGVSGKTETWSSFGNWMDRLNANLYEIPEQEKKEIDHIITNCVNLREKVRRIYHYVQDRVRYINVTIDVGGLQSYPASYVSRNKYGDCKALSTYMKALLSYAKIPSHYALVNSGTTIERIRTEIPSQQFDHIILAVPMEKDTIWLENTSSILPFDYLGTFTQNRNVLLVKDKGSALCRTPALKKDDVHQEINYNFKLDSNGTGTVFLDQKCRGSVFEEFLTYHGDLPEQDLAEYSKELIPLPNVDFRNLTITHQDRDTTNCTLLGKAVCKSQFRDVGTYKVIQYPFLKLPNLEKKNIRKRPLRISYPISQQNQVIYYLSEINPETVVLPRNRVLNSDFGTYQIMLRKNGNTIKITESIYLKSGDYSLEEYSRFYTFVHSIATLQQNTKITLKQ